MIGESRARPPIAERNVRRRRVEEEEWQASWLSEWCVFIVFALVERPWGWRGDMVSRGSRRTRESRCSSSKRRAAIPALVTRIIAPDVATERRTHRDWRFLRAGTTTSRWVSVSSRCPWSLLSFSTPVSFRFVAFRYASLPDRASFWQSSARDTLTVVGRSKEQSHSFVSSTTYTIDRHRQSDNKHWDNREIFENYEKYLRASRAILVIAFHS